MAKYKQHEAGEGGWSEWDRPVMQDYKLACCDCGLVHTMEFGAIKITKRLPDGSYRYVDLDPEKYQVTFRVKRNNRATAAVRRHKPPH